MLNTFFCFSVHGVVDINSVIIYFYISKLYNKMCPNVQRGILLDHDQLKLHTVYWGQHNSTKPFSLIEIRNGSNLKNFYNNSLILSNVSYAFIFPTFMLLRWKLNLNNFSLFQSNCLPIVAFREMRFFRNLKWSLL